MILQGGGGFKFTIQSKILGKVMWLYLLCLELYASWFSKSMKGRFFSRKLLHIKVPVENDNILEARKITEVFCVFLPPKNAMPGSEGVAQWLGAFTALAENLGSVPNTHIPPLTTTINSSSR